MSFSLLAIISANGSGEVVDQVRSALEASSAGWFRLVKYSGYAVALGCAMEAPETFHIIKRWWLFRFREEDREETRGEKRSWIVPLGAIGLIIIVLGIVAETYFEGKLSDVDAQIRQHESELLSKAETDAGISNLRAMEAYGVAEAAKLAQSKLEAKNLDLQRLLEEAKANTLRVEEKYSPRILSAKTREMLIGLLKKFPNTKSREIDIEVSNSAPDGERFAREIKDALNDSFAGWEAKVGSTTSNEGCTTGIFVVVHDTHATPIWAIRLRDALQMVGIEAGIADDPLIPVRAAYLLICPKN